MLGPRYVLTSYQKKLRDMDYEKHKQRLAVIQTHKRGINDDTEKVFRATFTDLQSKHQLFQSTEKVGSIDKVNQVLLDKLVKISKNQKPALYKTTNHWSHPGTLNTHFRKRELEKIAMENESMAKRLISQHGSVNFKKLEGDFEKHREFGKNVQKVGSPLATAYGKLPSIQSPKGNASPKKKLNKKKKSKTPENAGEVAAAETQETLEDEPVRAQTQPEAQQESKPEIRVEAEAQAEVPVQVQTQAQAQAQPALTISLENTSQVQSQSANRSQVQEEIKEESVPASNQLSQRTQKDENKSHVKSSGEISVSQVDEEKKGDKTPEKKDEKTPQKSNATSPGKDSDRNPKRSGTLQVASKFLGDNNNSPRRVSTQMPARKISTRFDKSENNTQRNNKSIDLQKSERKEAEKTDRKEVESEAPKSERKEEKGQSAAQLSQRGNESQREETQKENVTEQAEKVEKVEKAEKKEELPVVKEDGEANE